MLPSSVQASGNASLEPSIRVSATTAPSSSYSDAYRCSCPTRASVHEVATGCSPSHFTTTYPPHSHCILARPHCSIRHPPAMHGVCTPPFASTKPLVIRTSPPRKLSSAMHWLTWSLHPSSSDHLYEPLDWVCRMIPRWHKATPCLHTSLCRNPSRTPSL
jgi:hypothetical protein